MALGHTQAWRLGAHMAIAALRTNHEVLAVWSNTIINQSMHLENSLPQLPRISDWMSLAICMKMNVIIRISCKLAGHSLITRSVS